MLYDEKEVTSSRYLEWDSPEFVLPVEYLLTDKSSLFEALTVFYKAGGYDFFGVIEPARYGTRWLEFVGGLYRDIEEGRFSPDGERHTHPLTEEQRAVLREQGVPESFISDIC